MLSFVALINQSNEGSSFQVTSPAAGSNGEMGDGDGGDGDSSKIMDIYHPQMAARLRLVNYSNLPIDKLIARNYDYWIVFCK